MQNTFSPNLWHGQFAPNWFLEKTKHDQDLAPVTIYNHHWWINNNINNLYINYLLIKLDFIYLVYKTDKK